MAKHDKTRKLAPEPAPPAAPEEERSYYAAAERAGLRFFDAPPTKAAPVEKEDDNGR